MWIGSCVVEFYSRAHYVVIGSNSLEGYSVTCVLIGSKPWNMMLS